MLRLIPNSRYKLIYASGSEIEFEDQIPEAKHLIRVRMLDTGLETDLILLLTDPWLEIIKITDHK